MSRSKKREPLGWGMPHLESELQRKELYSTRTMVLLVVLRARVHTTRVLVYWYHRWLTSRLSRRQLGIYQPWYDVIWYDRMDASASDTSAGLSQQSFLGQLPGAGLNRCSKQLVPHFLLTC